MWPFRKSNIPTEATASAKDLTPQDFIIRRSEINKKLKATLQLELRVVLYAYAENSFILSATTGIWEAGEPFVLPFTATDDEIGNAIRELLMQTYVHPAPSYKESKLSDWAAFVVSGAKTGRAFEEKSVYLQIQTINTALRLEAIRRKPISDIYVGMTLPLGVDSEQLGASIRKLIFTIRLLDSQNAL